MILISGVISRIIQKSTLCTNKIRVIYFCSNCVDFLPGKVRFIIISFFYGGEMEEGGRGDCHPCPPLARAPTSKGAFYFKYVHKE